MARRRADAADLFYQPFLNRGHQMLQRMIDDFKEVVANSARLASLAAAIALTLFIALAFLCAAAFVYVLQTYGLIQACLAGAGVFFAVTVIAAICYVARAKRIKARAAERRTSPLQSALADPMLVATALQLVRAIGVKRLIPILAVGGLALGFLATRGTARAGDDAPPKA
jgi:uncharacterized membrane protein (DUF485 family)